jgi:hypothetical protein
VNNCLLADTGPTTPVMANSRGRPEGVIDDVFSVPSRLVQNFLKTHWMRLRLISSNTQLITYT